jgi:hypothetical protein
MFALRDRQSQKSIHSYAGQRRSGPTCDRIVSIKFFLNATSKKMSPRGFAGFETDFPVAIPRTFAGKTWRFYAFLAWAA